MKKTKKEIPAGPVWTPLNEKGERLRFPAENVDLTSFPARRAGGVGRVRIAGKEYQVTSEPCGLSCYCDARIIGYPDKPLKNGKTKLCDVRCGLKSGHRGKCREEIDGVDFATADKALRKAQRAQERFWAAMRELEVECGDIEIDGDDDLSSATIESLVENAL